MALRAILICLAIAHGLAALGAPSTAVAQNNSDAISAAQTRFNQLYGIGRFAEAAEVARDMVDLMKAQHGDGSPEHAASLYQLGNVLLGVSRYGEAETYLRRALEIFSADARLLQARMQTEVMLATTLIYQSKLDEGVPMMQRLAVQFESAFGLGDSRTISTLNNLAQTLQMTGRSAEAEPIYRKLIAARGDDDGNALANLGALHGNLAATLTQLGRRDEALVEMRKSVGFLRRIGNKTHRLLTIAVGNLGKLEHDAGNFELAESLYRESLAGAQAGATDSDIHAGALTNLAVLLRDLGRPNEAEIYVRQALAIFEKALGPDHPRTGSTLSSLAILASARGAWPDALALYDRSTAIAVRNARMMGSEDGRVTDAVYGLNAGDFPAHMRAIYHVAPNDPRMQEQAFGLAQRALNSRTAVAVSRMAARAAIPGSSLAGLIREQQDLLQKRVAIDQQLVATVAASFDKSKLDQALADKQVIESSLVRVSETLARDFPDYVAFDGIEPVSLANVQRSLRPHEALVAFVDVAGNPSIASEVYAWVVTDRTATWRRLDIGTEATAADVAALRCGLDGAMWRTPAGRGLCERLTSVVWSDARASEPLPFDLARAHGLYNKLLQPLEGELKQPNGQWRELLVVTSGSLATLPMSVLVTEASPPNSEVSPESYRRAQWLGRRQAITVLPSIASLPALRRHIRPSTAAKPMIGFGNPELDGSGPADGERALEARTKQRCPETALQRVAALVRKAASGLTAAIATRSGPADVAVIRTIAPLPETADEICDIARMLGADAGDMRLGAQATEGELKSLSSSGQLANYRIVHFATHGVLAGQLQAASEPGLILTPPATATEQDDGYLSASEVAGLKLDADWVILSACNTAAAEGGSGGSDALSGLARAFFYAGARALLVSHWEVASHPTVLLVSATMGGIAKDRSLGRAEALRRAMSEMIAQGDAALSHPSMWAPFIVVGDGGAAQTR